MKTQGTYTIVASLECCDSYETSTCCGDTPEEAAQAYLDACCCSKVRVVAVFAGEPVDLLTTTMRNFEEKD